MTPQQIEDFYLRWREWMLVATTHGAVVCANPKHEPFFKDMMERLREDSWWIVQQRESPVMLFHPLVSLDDMLFHVEGRGLMQPSELLGNVGFGRMRAKAPSRDGVTPWSEAKPKPGEVKSISPDGASSD
jgi:hypothetical protein